jgi:hypothetical protein
MTPRSDSSTHQKGLLIRQEEIYINWYTFRYSLQDEHLVYDPALMTMRGIGQAIGLVMMK